VFQHLGVAGYVRTAEALMQAIDRYRQGVAGIPGLKVLGDPDLAIVAVVAEGFDVFQVAEGLQARGWLPGLLQRPRALHRMMSMLHARSMEAYLSDLSEVTHQVRQAATPAASRLEATYGG
jgi:glutamate/tyrosine decarboxylase-like PLP-dependent enzyme